MNGRLYILKNSYPEKVRIMNKKTNQIKEYSYSNFSDFKNEINYFLQLSKQKEYNVFLFLTPKNRMLSFSSAFTYFGANGYVLLDFYDIAFYEFDEKNERIIFEDLFQKYLNLVKNNDKNLIFLEPDPIIKDLRISLVDDIVCEKCNYSNKNYEILGEALLKLALKQAFFDNEDELKIYTEICDKYFLTDKILIEKIAKKYKFLDYIPFDKSKKIENEYKYEKGKTSYISSSLKAFLYAIYLSEKNFEDVLQIVRSFLFFTDDVFVDFNKNYKIIDKIEQKYQKLADFLNKNEYLTNKNEISFKQIEIVINSKFDYKTILFYDRLKNFGYKFEDINLKTKTAKINYCFD